MIFVRNRGGGTDRVVGSGGSNRSIASLSSSQSYPLSPLRTRTRTRTRTRARTRPLSRSLSRRVETATEGATTSKDAQQTTTMARSMPPTPQAEEELRLIVHRMRAWVREVREYHHPTLRRDDKVKAEREGWRQRRRRRRQRRRQGLDGDNEEGDDLLVDDVVVAGVRIRFASSSFCASASSSYRRRRCVVDDGGNSNNNNNIDDDVTTETTAPTTTKSFLDDLRRSVDLVIADEIEAFASDRDRHRRLFEVWACELGGLRLLVDVLSGVAFYPCPSSSSSTVIAATVHGSSLTSSSFLENSGAEGGKLGADTSEAFPMLVLPCPLIAARGLHYLSYLIRNTVEPTSLYLLLSDRRVRNLIDMPVELYERYNEERDEVTVTGGDGKTSDPLQSLLRSKRKGLSNPKKGGGNSDNVAAAFVGFLQSLATRLNVDTAQFFLSYSDSVAEHKSVLGPSGSGGGGGGSRVAATSERKEEDILHLRRWFQLMAPLAGPISTGVASNNLLLSASGSIDANGDDDEDNLPIIALYNRALAFCALSDHQRNVGEGEAEKVVRLKAVNTCLDILQFVASRGVCFEAALPLSSPSPSQASSSPTQASLSSEEKGDEPPTTGEATVASNSTHRHQLEMARFVCAPSRVRAFVMPLIEGLSRLNVILAERIEEMDALVVNTASDDAQLAEEEVESKRRCRDDVASEVELIMSDMGLELALFNELLKIGLTSLNEQATEIFLESFLRYQLLSHLSISSECVDQNDPPRFASPHSLVLGKDFGVQVDGSTLPQIVRNILVDPFSFEWRAPQRRKNKFGAFFGGSRDAMTTPNYHIKASLIAIAATFCHVNNTSLLHLLFVALFHPFSENVSICHKLVVPLSVSIDMINVEIDDASGLSCYDYGRRKKEDDELATSEDKSVSHAKSNEQCVFSYAPQLANIFEGRTAIAPALNGSLVSSNLHRQALIAYLNGEVPTLEPFASLATKAALSSIDDVIANSIAHGVRMAPSRAVKVMISGKPKGESSLRSFQAKQKKHQSVPQDGKEGYWPALSIFGMRSSPTGVAEMTAAKLTDLVPSLCTSIADDSVRNLIEECKY